jgi:hypothetical protein
VSVAKRSTSAAISVDPRQLGARLSASGAGHLTVQRFRRFFRMARDWIRPEDQGSASAPGAGLPSSFCGFLRGRAYVVRRAEARARRGGAGEWRLEMAGVPPILFPATGVDTEESVRATAGRLLVGVLPEDVSSST